MLIAVIALSLSCSPDVQTDPRLDARINVRVDAANTRLLCEKLSAATGVTLTADKALHEDIVVLLAKDRPAKEVLTQIGKHFLWEWAPTNDGYVLRPTSEFWRQEAATRLNGPWRHIEKEVKAAKALAVKQRSPLKSYLRYHELEPSLGKLQGSYGLEREVDPERDRLEEEFEACREGMDMADALGYAILGNLTPSDAVEIDTGRIVFSTKPKGFQRPFSLSVRPYVASMLRNLQVLMNAGRSLAKNRQPRTDQTDTEDDGYNFLLPPGARAWFGPQDVSSVRASVGSMGDVHIDILNQEGKVVGGTMCTLPRIWEDEDKPRPPIKIAPELDRPLRSTEALVEAADKLDKRHKGSFQEEVRELRKDPEAEPLRTYGKFLNEVANTGGYCFIGDGYDACLWAYALGKVKPTIEQTLAEVAYETESSCTLDDGWIRMREKDWGYHRRAHVPRGVAVAILSLSESKGFTVDDAARVASSLNEHHFRGDLIDSLTDFYWPSDSYFLLCAWSELSPAARAALRSGTPLVVADLPFKARTHLSTWAFRVGASLRYGYGGCGTRARTSFDEPDFLSESGESYTAEDYWLDTDSSEVLPFQGQEQFALKYVLMPGVVTEYEGGNSWYFEPPQTVAARLRRPEQQRWKLAEQDAHRFSLKLGRGSVGLDLVGQVQQRQIITPDLLSLPPNLRQRVQRHIDEWNLYEEKYLREQGKGQSGPPPPNR